VAKKSFPTRTIELVSVRLSSSFPIILIPSDAFRPRQNAPRRELDSVKVDASTECFSVWLDRVGVRFYFV